MEHLKGLFEWSGSKHFQPSNCSDGKGTEATHGYLTIPLIYTRVLSSYCEKFEERSGDGGETTNRFKCIQIYSWSITYIIQEYQVAHRTCCKVGSMGEGATKETPDVVDKPLLLKLIKIRKMLQ